MTNIFALLSLSVYILLGLICLVMAIKTLSSEKFLPFHEKAAVTEWSSIDKPLQLVIITLLRISGLGFTVAFLSLTIFPIVNYLKPVPALKFLIPIIPFIFCSGLFIYNYSLFRKTKTKTPWKGALISMGLILVAFLLSLCQNTQ
jgi:hypothetical protein